MSEENGEWSSESRDVLIAVRTFDPLPCDVFAGVLMGLQYRYRSFLGTELLDKWTVGPLGVVGLAYPADTPSGHLPAPSFRVSGTCIAKQAGVLRGKLECFESEIRSLELQYFARNDPPILPTIRYKLGEYAKVAQRETHYLG
ncbi:hypothetical protein NDU88_001473 [Pleurodeles waltl]|uniref:Uncharacterized protein n=1 Tax=Pleurodeles waltl TaxID=8319 RepID=A0AAV7P424_PLEWA|nr:hypothetical protein NDU88_001473 [Pleurodeles waltl]